MLSLKTIGRKEKTTPEQEHIIFNKIAWITLNLRYFVKLKDPLEQTINIQTINIKTSKLLFV